MNEVKEKCGVFGVYGHGLDVSRLAFYGLFALQHRGQESSGIAAADGEIIRCYKNNGLVTHVYSEEHIRELSGHLAIGHNRYSTSAGSGLLHAQPVIVGEHFLALAHNGNLPSVAALQSFLAARNIITAGRNDSELMADAIYWYMQQGDSLPAATEKAFPLFTGAFCLLVMTKDTLVAVRDECGIRPFSLGKLPVAGGEGYVFASETCAFRTLGAEFVRDINPGEMVVLDNAGLRSVQIVPPRPKLDIFEFVYFARPDSHLNGQSVYEVRHRCGERLAEEYRPEVDLIVPVPETAIPVAAGYARAAGVPFEMALVKNRYIHRTFIQPDQRSRDLGVKLKLTPLPEVLKGKRVILIDDSIVRGTTSRQIVKMLFEAGAVEVHFLVSSPPVRFPDFYGIDTPRQQDLIASHMKVREIQDYLGATSLYYLSLAGLLAATGLPAETLNTSCFTGQYPLDLKERTKEFVAEPAGAATTMSQPALSI